MEAGQQITAGLRLVRRLGRGGMGEVWVADHIALGAQVAVKFMWRMFAEHAQFVERFHREAAAAAQLKNPHVAQVFDHGVTPTGEPYIVMELLEGEDLGKRVKRSGPLPPALVADILTQSAKALGKAHQIGIVHRDIKPDNIFLTELDGDIFIKVLDFGIAKVTGDSSVSMTSTGGTFGTPLYMSPEQLLSAKHVDHRTDLWSLGVVAYHCLTGAVPFPGDTIGAISVAVHTGVFAPPSKVRPDLPPGLDTWFQRTFRRNADERFTSAKEMADAFRTAITATPTAIPDIRASHPSLPDAPLPAALPPASPAVPPSPVQPAPIASPLAAPITSPEEQRTIALSPAPPRTLDGKAITLGGPPAGQTSRLPITIAVITVLALLAGLIALRPWKSAEPDTASRTDLPATASTVATALTTATTPEPITPGTMTPPVAATTATTSTGAAAPAPPDTTPSARPTTHPVSGPLPPTAKPAATAPRTNPKTGHGDDPGF